MVKIVTDAAPLIHLFNCRGLQGLALLLRLYDNVHTSTYVYEQELLFPKELVDFKNLQIITSEPEKLRLEEALQLYTPKRINFGEITCAALYASSNYAELIMANRDAESAFVSRGINVRNVLELAYLALQKSVYSEKDAKQFLECMAKFYRPTQRVIHKFKSEGFEFLLPKL